jgi:hypothetical protein
MSIFSQEERDDMIKEEILLGSSYEGAVLIVETAEEILEKLLEGKILDDNGEFVDVN